MLWPDPSLGHTNVQCSLLTAMVSTLNRACRPKVSLLPEVMLRTTPGLSKDTSSNAMSSAQVWLGTQLENATKPLQVATVRPLQYLFFPFSLSVCRSRKSLRTPTSLPGQAYMYKRDLDRYRDTMGEATELCIFYRLQSCCALLKLGRSARSLILGPHYDHCISSNPQPNPKPSKPGHVQ